MLNNLQTVCALTADWLLSDQPVKHVQEIVSNDNNEKITI